MRALAQQLHRSRDCKHHLRAAIRSSPQALMRRPAVACPLGFGSSEQEKDSTSSAAEAPAGVVHEIFRCKGIESSAVLLRRRVQFGMALEFFGTQSANLLFHDGFDVISTFSDFNNFLMILHIYVVWRYASTMRDALLARHVTRIAVLLPHALPAASTERDAGRGKSGCARRGPSANTELDAGNSANSSEEDVRGMDLATLQAAASSAVAAGQSLNVIVETGPWMRYLELHASGAPEQEGHAAKAVEAKQVSPSLGDLVRLGALHVDRAGGEVPDADTLQRLLVRGHCIEAEKLHKDEALMREAYVSEHSVSPSLEGVSSESLQWLEARPWLHSLLQFHGSKAMNLFGSVALAMGIGTIFLWLPIPGIGKSLGGNAMRQEPRASKMC